MGDKETTKLELVLIREALASMRALCVTASDTEKGELGVALWVLECLRARREAR